MLVFLFQFYPIPRGNLTPAIRISPLLVYPNNQQHFPYHHSTGTSPFDIVSLFSLTNGFDIIVFTYNNQYVLMLPASPPGYTPSHGSSFFRQIDASRKHTKTHGIRVRVNFADRGHSKLEVLEFTATHAMPTMEFISKDFEGPSESLQQYLALGQVQKMQDYNCSYDKSDGILIVSAVLPQHLITVEVHLEEPFVVGGLRVGLSGSDTAIDNGRYTVQTPDQVLSVDAVTNIEMTKIINRPAANSVNAESRETFSGIWLPTWTADKSSLWDSHIYRSAENEYHRSLN